MPTPIYMQRQPTFMEQFLSTGIMDNIMRGIMMRNQNQRADAANIQGLQEKGYSEADYTAPTPQEKAAGYRGAAPGQYQGKTFDPSQQVEVAGRRFDAPKVSYKAVRDEKTGRPMLEVYKNKKLLDVKPLALDQQTRDSSAIKNYNFALQQHTDNPTQHKHPGSFTTWTKAQKRAGATRISLGQKVAEQNAKQIAKARTSINTPEFRKKAHDFVSKQEDADLMPKEELELAVRSEMERSIKELHPNAKVERRIVKGKLAWFVNNKFLRFAE